MTLTIGQSCRKQHDLIRPYFQFVVSSYNTSVLHRVPDIQPVIGRKSQTFITSRVIAPVSKLEMRGKA